MNLLGYLLTGATAAAVVKLLDNLLMWVLNRRAAKNDRADAQQAAERETQEKWRAATETAVKELQDGLRIIMLDRIRTLGQEYLRDGEIDFDDRKYLNEMHSVYRDSLGGDGDLDNLMENVNELPLK